MNWEKAALKAEEQHEWAGTNQLRWDNYVRNIVNAALGDTVLYEVCPDCNGTGQVGRWEASGAFPEECSCATGFVQVWPV